MKNLKQLLLGLLLITSLVLVACNSGSPQVKSVPSQEKESQIENSQAPEEPKEEDKTKAQEQDTLDESENKADNPEQKLLEVRDKLDQESAVIQLVVPKSVDDFEFHELEIEDWNAWLKEEDLVLIDFWAPWCGPCQMASPYLDELAGRFPNGLKIVKINVDHAPASLPNQYGVQGIPALFLIDKGEQAKEWVGFSTQILDDITTTIEEKLN